MDGELHRRSNASRQSFAGRDFDSGTQLIHIQWDHLLNGSDSLCPRTAESGSRRSIEHAFWSRAGARSRRWPIKSIYLTRCEALRVRDFRFWFGFWIDRPRLKQELWPERVTKPLPPFWLCETAPRNRRGRAHLEDRKPAGLIIFFNYWNASQYE